MLIITGVCWFQPQISFYGLAANPVKTISLPYYLLSCERKVRAGSDWLRPQSSEHRAKLPALLFQIIFYS